MIVWQPNYLRVQSRNFLTRCQLAGHWSDFRTQPPSPTHWNVLRNQILFERQHTMRYTTTSRDSNVTRRITRSTPSPRGAVWALVAQPLGLGYRSPLWHRHENNNLDCCMRQSSAFRLQQGNYKRGSETLHPTSHRRIANPNCGPCRHVAPWR
jgi:hypothetical protein